MKMSFYNGTLDRAKAIELIENTDREIRYTYGFKYKRPTTFEVLISKERALELARKESMLDIDFDTYDFIDMNAYSAIDMW